MSHFDTDAVHGGREDLTGLGVHVPPIDLSTTYPLPSITDGGSAYDLLGAGNAPDETTKTLVYQRLWNPTVARFEQAVATLEQAPAAVAYASGMAALSALLLAAVQSGKRHVVAVRPLYGGTDHVLDSGLLGTSVTWTSAEPSDVRAAIGDDTALVILETPANPTLDLVDIAAVASAAGDVPLVVDSTFATPVLQQPLRHGARLVLHSATKFLGGHGDAMGGVIAGDPQWIARLRTIRALTGGLLHPMGAYQLHRGLQTLPARVRAQQESAGAIAHWLTEQPSVAQVFYPGLKACDPGGLIGTQQLGPGSLLSFRLDGGYEAASTVAQGLSLITHAVSLGGVDSLVQHPAALTHRPVADGFRPDADILRLSVGLESLSDLLDDLTTALSRVS